MIVSSLCLLSIATALAQAQPDEARTLKTPLLGYLTSESPLRVRSILGAPGAVTVGDAIPLPDEVTRFVAAPGQQFGIVEWDGAAESGVLRLGISDRSEVQVLPNSFAHADRIAFSPSGTVAVLYSADRGQAQVIRGLPSRVHIDDPIDLSPAGLPLVSLAVSDDATSVLAGVSNGSNGAVWLFAAGQAPRQLTSAGVPSALRFFTAKQDAVLADSGWQQVSLLSSATAAQVLAGPAEGITAPADVEISTDQQTVWIADSGRLFSIDLGSGAVSGMDSPMGGAKFTRLAGRSVLLLTSPDGTGAGLWAPQTGNGSVWRLTAAGLQ